MSAIPRAPEGSQYMFSLRDETVLMMSHKIRFHLEIRIITVLCLRIGTG